MSTKAKRAKAKSAKADYQKHKAAYKARSKKVKAKRKVEIGITYHRNSYLKLKYGISEKEYFEYLEDQNGCCLICGTDDPGVGAKNFMIDHCHTTNKIRGLLCRHCNTGLGLFRDSKELLLAAYSYLEANE